MRFGSRCGVWLSILAVCLHVGTLTSKEVPPPQSLNMSNKVATQPIPRLVMHHPSGNPLCHAIKTCVGRRCGENLLCDDISFAQKVDVVLTSLAPSQESVLQQRLREEALIESSAVALTLDQPNYVLPLYYTASPNHAIYTGQTPNGQSIKKEEFKAQISLKYPIWQHIAGSRFHLGMSYTQSFFWQIFSRSQFFRETNYMPAITLSNNFHHNWMGTVGLVHQSNGRGGDLERSWNRLYFDLLLSGKRWMVSVKPWVLVFKAYSSDLHNPDISRYLGHGRVLVAAQLGKGQQLSFYVRNAIESVFKRGAYNLSYSVPIYGRNLRFYVQAFSGYGQSLIEYNHKTRAVGMGFAFNDWIVAPSEHD